MTDTPRLLHYSPEPFTGPVRSRVRELRVWMKPRGLWVSVEGENDWKSWCEGEGFALNRLGAVTEIILQTRAKILRVSGARDLDRLTKTYAAERMPGIDLSVGIDWPRLAEEHDGIIIAPYIWSRRLHDSCAWYYGWDCASGCIWRRRAVAETRSVETADRCVP